MAQYFFGCNEYVFHDIMIYNTQLFIYLPQTQASRERTAFRDHDGLILGNDGYPSSSERAYRVEPMRDNRRVHAYRKDYDEYQAKAPRNH